MKYSEAIRLGSTLGPQGFGVRAVDGSLCANQAAWAAIGKPLGGVFRLFQHCFLPCPVCGTQEHLATVISWCLNDTHRWTRERIADWLVTSGHDFEIDLTPAPVECTPESATEPEVTRV